MPMHPTVYAELLAEKLEKHDTNVWLVNTGWTGGPHGEGERMDLKYTRRMLNAAIDGELENASFTSEPVFGLQIPGQVEGVPDEVLIPRNTWADQNAYDQKAKELAEMFVKNFGKYADQASKDILEGGPKI